ncbi:MAG TPA: DUF932 domain-containing protein [Verrucomicrobiae bacterium]|nr:DUF932 domain-containing protein [Verrucomicrobiae bacterium]
MNIIEMEPAPVRQRTPQGLLLHCGGRVVGREELLAVPTPEGTETWYPLDHGAILEEVEGQLGTTGFTIEGERHALSHGGMRYFAVLAVSLPGRIEDEYQWVVGLRNSHDMTYPAGLVAGTHVLVCSNLAFCGEVRISRKHTRFAMRDLRHLVARAVGQLGERFRSLDARVAAYKEARVPDWLAHDVVIRAADCRAITVSQIPDVLKEWRRPEHEAFRPRNAWSLFNAFTGVYREINPHTALRRGEALHGLFDAVVGMS